MELTAARHLSIDGPLALFLLTAAAGTSISIGRATP